MIWNKKKKKIKLTIYNDPYTRKHFLNEPKNKRMQLFKHDLFHE